MTAFLIAIGVASPVLLGLVALRLGILVGWRRGFSEGFDLARNLDREDAEDNYFDQFGGLIDAGRKREN